jgi:hypothetical protein
MGREGMPQDVTTDRFGQSSRERCPLHGPLEGILMEVMPTHASTAGVYGHTIRRKYILPDPFACGMGIFPLQGWPQRVQPAYG